MKKNNIQIPAENGKVILLDYEFQQKATALPVVIFCHGLKGFKDWGAWGLMGSAFAKANYLFIKFNFSHNGGTPDQPIDFPDLEAFGQNNYSKELRDVQRVLDWLEKSNLPFDKDKINLIGHSRAGGITIITTANDHRINKLITLAGVADYEERFPEGDVLKKWKQEGVYHVKNGRTHQDMPFYYQMFEDFESNKAGLNILSAASRIEQPHLIIHGTADPTVLLEDAYRIKENNKNAQVLSIRNANHVFGASHPWKYAYLPHDLRRATQCMINFLNNE